MLCEGSFPRKRFFLAPQMRMRYQAVDPVWPDVVISELPWSFFVIFGKLW
jgi:hypothetical protein